LSKAAKVLVSVGLLALVILLAGGKAVLQVLSQVESTWLAAAFAVAFLDRVVTNYRWQVLLTGRGVILKFLKLFRVQLAANFIGSFLPGFIGVDAARITGLCRNGFPATAVIAATLVDRTTLALATLLAGGLAVLFLAHDRVPAYITQGVLLIVIGALAVTALLLLPVVRRWLRLKVLPRFPQKLAVHIHEVADATLAYRHQPVVALEVVAATLVLFALRIAFAKAVAHACGLDIAWNDLLLVIPVLWVAVMMPFTIGGLGIQDAGYVVLMALIGIAAPIAVGMSLLEHVISRLVCLPGVFFLNDVAGFRSAVKSRKRVSGLHEL
jgi:uncharacterized protein (TIRG00374 family)